MKIKVFLFFLLFFSSLVRAATIEDVSYANVYIYDADHPEWLYHVSETTTDANGNYEFSTLTNSANNGYEYVDGDPIPPGTYSLLFYKPSTFDPIAGVTTDPIVAVIPITITSFGTLTGSIVESDLAVSYDVTPNVVTMFGLNKNIDGTTTWGPINILVNSNIEIGFDMTMDRGSVQYISVLDANGSYIDGVWNLSADWQTATFQPYDNMLLGEYKVSVPSTTTNVYGNTIGYESTGTFAIVASEDIPYTTPVTTSYNIQIKDGWQLLGAVDDIDVTIFDNTCVDYIWSYDSSNTPSPWKLHISNGNTYNEISNYGVINMLGESDGFWLKGNSDCNITISTDSLTTN